jgi:hypothetical protein
MTYGTPSQAYCSAMESLKYVSTQLGNASIRMTADVYGHLEVARIVRKWIGSQRWERASSWILRRAEVASSHPEIEKAAIEAAFFLVLQWT